jgi:hypothetical protein
VVRGLSGLIPTLTTCQNATVGQLGNCRFGGVPVDRQVVGDAL